MKRFKKVLIGLGAVVVVLAVVGLFLPRTVHVERSAVVAAPAATVFTVLNGFHQFGKWAPWPELDPNMKTTFDGPDAGVGAKYAWSGNDQVGTGSQEIVESRPFSLVKSKLVFGGFEGADDFATFALTPEGQGTRVVWSFDGDNKYNVLSRYFGLMMDAFIGPDYEKGLAKLKTFVEGLPHDDFSSLEIGVEEVKPLAIAYVSTASATDDKAIGVALGVAYGKVSGFVNSQGLRQTAPPVARYQEPQNSKGAPVLRFDAGIPVDREDVKADGDVKLTHTYAGRVVKAVYHGPYSGLKAAHQRVQAFLAAAGYERAGAIWEQYVTDPGTTPESELVTHIYYPVK